MNKGIKTPVVTWRTTKVGDMEATTIAALTALLEPLTPEQRARLLKYALSRWGFPVTGKVAEELKEELLVAIDTSIEAIADPVLALVEQGIQLGSRAYEMKAEPGVFTAEVGETKVE